MVYYLTVGLYFISNKQVIKTFAFFYNNRTGVCLKIVCVLPRNRLKGIVNIGGNDKI